MSKSEQNYDEFLFYHKFGTEDYSVAIQLSQNGNEFEVTVDDVNSANRWSNSFSDKYVENLTKKTGNYKNFDTFFKMLLNSLEKSSSSVSVKLLSFSDLKAMRRTNSTENISQENHDRVSPPETSDKKYLILVYTAEFDRIQYPLPLLFYGKPDVVDQQNQIRELKAEIKTLKNTSLKDSTKTAEELLVICENLRKERNSFREELEIFKRRKVSGNRKMEENERMTDQIIYLEKELKNYQTKLQRAERAERTKHGRLMEELQRLRGSENSLKIKVKTLTNELSFYKKTRRESQKNYSTMSPSRTVSNRSPFKARSEPGMNNFRINGQSFGKCQNSVAVSPRRFNPTAYIDEKKRKEEMSRRIRSKIIREKLSSRTSSLDSGRLKYPERPSSVASSVTSDDEVGNFQRERKKRFPKSWEKKFVPPKHINKLERLSENYDDSSFECDSVTPSVRQNEREKLEDVDERLKKLQEMMKAAFT